MYVFVLFFFSVRVTEWPPIWKSCSLGLRYVFLVYVRKCHFSFFTPLGLWSGVTFLIAPFPDYCRIVNFYHSSALEAIPLHNQSDRFVSEMISVGITVEGCISLI